MKIVYLTFIILTTSIVCELKIINTQSSLDTQLFLNHHPSIHVQVSSTHVDSDDFQTLYLKMIETGRSKRKAYDIFIRKCRNFLEALVKNMLVPNGKCVIQSPIQINFINKKRQWEFSRTFQLRVYYSEFEQFQTVNSIVAGFKMMRLQYSSVQIRNKAIKYKIIQSFITAKTQLQNFLQSKFDGNIFIKQLTSFQVQGFKEYSVVSSQEGKPQKYPNSQSSSSKRNKNSQKNIEQQQRVQNFISEDFNINIYAIFQIGNINEQQSGLNGSYRSNQKEIQSDAENEEEQDSEEDPDQYNQEM